VHVEHLAQELDRRGDVDLAVHAFGEPRPSPLVAATYQPWERAAEPGGGAGAALGTLSVDVAMAAALHDVELVHSHTWYAAMGGHLAGLVHGVPHVSTAHSLEPLRPWKQEQLGGGNRLSSWCEQTALEGADAVIAVSDGMRADVLRCYPAIDPDRVHVIHNGIDHDTYRPVTDADALAPLGIDPSEPYVLFVGRITRQKGIVHLLDAVGRLESSPTVVLLAGQPDTPEIAAEVRTAIDELQAATGRIVWIPEMLPRSAVVQLMAHAAVFVCPSVYIFPRARSWACRKHIGIGPAPCWWAKKGR
jgi:starch synthase